MQPRFLTIRSIAGIAKLLWFFKRHGPETILDLPLIEDRVMESILELLQSMQQVSFYIDKKLALYMPIKIMLMTLHNGHSKYSALLTVLLSAIIRSATGKFELADKLDSIAFELSDKWNFKND